MSKLRRVTVDWVDTVALNHAWKSPSHYIKMALPVAKMQTTGYLVKKTKRSVLVAHSRMMSRRGVVVDYVMVIPRSQVRRIKKIK